MAHHEDDDLAEDTRTVLARRRLETARAAAKGHPRVFIVQEPLKRFPGGIVKERINYDTLRPYGELKFIFGWTELKPRDYEDTTRMVAKLRQELATFTDDDALVCLGNPALCAMALAVALECNNGYAVMLDWIRDEERYREVTIDLNHAAA